MASLRDRFTVRSAVALPVVAVPVVLVDAPPLVTAVVDALEVPATVEVVDTVASCVPSPPPEPQAVELAITRASSEETRGAQALGTAPP
jgi:hypothetical protein